MRPLLLGPNQPPDRFYRGGPRIAEFRGSPDTGERTPEDWIGSTTTLAGDSRVGLTALDDGTLLRDAIAVDPEGWLGAEHVGRFGADTMLLVKLLDPGQRLPVHAHPDRAFAAAHLGHAHGKAEAWFILEPGEIHLGLRRDVGREELLEIVERQDSDALLGLLHRMTVAAGDAVYVPPGVLHATGEGVFLVEVQEPEDLSILLEWRDFELDGASDGNLGLGFPVVIDALDRVGRSADEVAAWISRCREGEELEGEVLPAEAAPYFGLAHHDIRGSTALGAGFAVGVVISGELVLETAHGGALELRRGHTFVVPAAVGALRAVGEGRLLLCRPPHPEVA
jgi:mannose-6-phosphate isomerase